MKVSELIEELSKLDPDLDVRVYADHGQTHYKAECVEIVYASEDEYAIEFAEDCEGELEDPYTFVTIWS